ncbi:MAG TPA: DUF4276 family protein [Myxococcota bacterium]|nr:DUF4276 family protein [Myxococcota bacterium]
MTGFVYVEGHGEVEAVDNLLSRLWSERSSGWRWSQARRWPGIHRPDRLERAAENARASAASGLLILRDEDDACPKELGPSLARHLGAMQLPFPAAVVLLHPEYEVLFLPCLPALAGVAIGTGGARRAAIQAETRWDGDTWEARRGVKEWLSRRYPPGRSYKPTLDQLPLTRMLDLAVLRAADVPCFGTLERALDFLADAGPGEVYPRPG